MSVIFMSGKDSQHYSDAASFTIATYLGASAVKRADALYYSIFSLYRQLVI